jgi:hypothetical protein
MEASVRSGESRENAAKQASRPGRVVPAEPVRRFVQIEPGIYRDTKTGRFYERPTIDGKRTWRKLIGKNLKFSREEYCRRRNAVACRSLMIFIN